MDQPAAELSPRISQPPVELRTQILRQGPWIQLGYPDGFAVTRLRVRYPGLPAALRGLRIIHLSDLHARRGWWRAYDELIELVNRSADLVVFTGDLVDDKRDYRPALPIIQRLLRGFQTRLGTFSILGNHDGSLPAAHLPPLGVHFIDGKYMRFQVDSAEIELIGLPGVHRQDMDPRSLLNLPPRTPGVPRFILSHYPDQVLLTRPLRPDLYLTGHTHGGQICLPGGLPIFRHDSLPARLCTGVHRFADTWLIVNRGIGFSGPRVRLFCPAEVIQIVLEDALGSEDITNAGQNAPLPAGPPGDNPPATSSPRNRACPPGTSPVHRPSTTHPSV